MKSQYKADYTNSYRAYLHANNTNFQPFCRLQVARGTMVQLALDSISTFPQLSLCWIQKLNYIGRAIEFEFSTPLATQALRTLSNCEKWPPNHTHLCGGHWRSCLRAALPLLALPQDPHCVFTRPDRNRLGRSHSPSGGPIYDLPSACPSLAQSFTLWCGFALSGVRIHNAYIL